MDGHEARLTALKNLKASRNAQHIILKATENEICRLQKETSATTLQRGIQSLPDDLVREIFEAAFDLYGNEYGSESYPFKLSHVNRRFRAIALETPRIWTRLSNVLATDQLKYHIERSKSAGLTIAIRVNMLDDEYGCTVAEFLKITTALCSHWQNFEYIVGFPVRTEQEDYGYTHPALLDYPHLDLPRITRFLWQKRVYDESEDNLYLQTFFEFWNMPKLSDFEGLNVLMNPPLVVSNLASVTLDFNSEHISVWVLDDTLAALASSTRLTYLCITFAEISSSPLNFQVPPTLLKNLVSFRVKLLRYIDQRFILTFLSALKMPILTTISFTLNLTLKKREFHEVDFIQEIFHTSCNYPKLQNFAMDLTGLPQWNLVVTLGMLLPSLQEVTLRGIGLCPYAARLDAPVSWRLVRLRGFDRTSYETVCRMATTDPYLGSCKIDIPDERNLSMEAIHLLGDRLIHETCIS
ncbi:hypothetical protein BD410DRAFT_780720 [Rickenella mellea]|uniref:F-box domain-containing protein n=1 Tax=Rickenella mellea TaxID=50990 RepID=A0A4R5XG55_9AGAM|nr:hypothetical protein BD410DRAFT_780720 [Rickenella mellea]